MPNNVVLIVDELIINNLDSEPMLWVDVTHVNDPTNFYVRPIRFNILVKHYHTLSTFKITSEIYEEKLVFYNMSSSRIKYIRARVTKIYNDSQECDIFAIDYGFTEERVAFENLMECPLDILDTPALAFCSLLGNCFPLNPERGWPRFSTRVFRRYLRGGRVRMTILGRTPVQLIINLMNADLEDVATLLAVKGYSKLGAYDSCIPWEPLIIRKRQNFYFRKLYVDDIFRVRVLSGKSLNLFYVKEVTDYETFLEKIDVISFYARQQNTLLPHHLIPGTVVCAKDIERDRYDRAFVKCVIKDGSEAVLHLVDWGTDEVFTIDKIKYMPKEALSTPMTTIMCSAPDNQAWDNGFINFLTPGFEFYIKVKALGYEFEREYQVDILPIEEVEIEVGATCLGYNDYYKILEEPRFENFLLDFEEEEEPQNLIPQNVLPEIPMEEETIEELITWIKGMGKKRTNKKPLYTFRIIKKYTNVKDFSTEAGYYAFQNNGPYVLQKLLPSPVEFEEPIEAESGVIKGTNISKSRPEECLPSTSGTALKLNSSTSKRDDEECLPSTSGTALKLTSSTSKSDDGESLPSTATATAESDASSASGTPKEF